MQLRYGFLTVRSPVVLCAAWFLLLYFDSSGFFAISLLASMWHELGHGFCYLLLFRQPPQLTLSFSGIGMKLRADRLSPAKTLLLAAAGPLANAVAATVWFVLLHRRFTLIRAANFAAHLLTAGFNCLPVPPLDGYRCIKALVQIFGRKLHFQSK